MSNYLLIPVLLLATTAMGALPSGYETLYLTRRASPAVEEAANLMADLLERAHGERPVVRRVPLFQMDQAILIGPSPEAQPFDRDPLTDQVLVERTVRGLEIRGSDNTATCFAVYRFIEKFLGWRYYHPGSIGLERLDQVPAYPEVRGGKAVLLMETPGYHSRNLSKMSRGIEGPDWSQWNGLRERFSYNHSLHRVLPPSLYDTHPDWFAKDQEGQPMPQPYPYPHGDNFHPDLTRPEVRDWVVEQTARALQDTLEGKPPAPGPAVRQSPGMVSASLSLGDSFVFGHFPESYSFVPDGFFRRWPDWANHVFDYTNELATRLVRQWEQIPESEGKPDLYLGALSYLTWENVPDFQVHPSIVPYLTFDRSQWYDPRARAGDLELVERWSRNGSRVLGTWDYLFGYGFLIPRSLSGIVADSIPSLHDRGVRAYFSQVAPLWPYDAHTNWLTARLLWNPSADPVLLTREFFSEFYGPAAPAMKAFFNEAEAAWMNQEARGWWLRFWKDPWQVALFPENRQLRLQGHLESALRLAGNYQPQSRDVLPRDRFPRRVQATFDLFQVTRTLAAYINSGWRLQSIDWTTASTGDMATGKAVAIEGMRLRGLLVSSIQSLVEKNPAARSATDLEWILRYDSIGASLAAMALRARELQWPEGSESPSLEALLGDWLGLENCRGQPALVDPRARAVLGDTDFSGFGTPGLWHQQALDSEGLDWGRIAETGGFFAANVRRGHIFQFFRARPDHFYLGTLDLETQQSPTGEIYIRVDFFGPDLQPLEESQRFRISPTGLGNRRQTLRALAQAPAGTAYGRIFIRFYEMDPGSRVELDHCQVLDLGWRESP